MEKELAQKDGGSLKATKAGRRTKASGGGLTASRHFTTVGVDRADKLTREYRSANITGGEGEVVFEQKERAS